MPKSVLLIFLSVAIIIAALVEGCGGGGGDQTTALTKAEFIKAGDAVCQATHARQQQLLAQYIKKHPSALTSDRKAREGVLVAVVLPVLRTEAAGLEKLVPPAADRKQIEELVGPLRDVVAELERNPGALMGAKAAETLSPLEDQLAPAGKAAAAYGFAECAQPL
jgi:hypothetical protein